MSSRAEKLEEFARAFNDSQANYEDDLAKAQTREQVAAIRENKDTHQRNWANAASAALDAQNDEIEAAHQAAKAANDATTEAREDAEGIAKIIRRSAKAASALTDVLKAAGLTKA